MIDAARTAARRDALRRTLREDDVEALLVSAEANVGYLTGFTGDATYLLLTAGRDVLLSDGRYATQLERECPEVEAHIRPVGPEMSDAVAEVVAKLGLGRVAFEAPRLTVADREDLGAKAPAVAWKPVRDRVEALRLVKDDAEVAAIRRAVALAEDAFAEVRARLGPDRAEKDVADDLELAMRRRGAAGASFPPIVAAGANAALPHYRPGAGARIGDADFTLVDWGADGGPYKSDLTRMVVTATVSPKFAEVYGVVLEAQARALAAIRPGVAAGAVDAEARSAIEAAGFGRFFTHGLGHGLGREVHEGPGLRRGAATALRPGMVVTVEPGIYLPGWGGIRIEDDVLVTPDGHEILTRVPRSLDALRVG